MVKIREQMNHAGNRLGIFAEALGKDPDFLGCGAHGRDRRCCARAVCLESICRPPSSRHGRYSRAWPIATPLASGIKTVVKAELCLRLKPQIGWVGSGV